MAASSVVAFWAVAMLLIIVPGPDWAFTIGAGLRGHSVRPAVGGIVLGYAGMTVVVAAGVGALVARSPGLLTALTVVGGLYLMWLGITTFARLSAPNARLSAPNARLSAPNAQPSAPNAQPSAQSAQPSAQSAQAGAPARTTRATLARGVGVSGLNPKGLLLFLALLPQFTSPRWSWPLPVQLGFLGLIFMLTCGTFYLCLGSFARKVLLSRPAAARAVSRFSGAAMVVIGAFLLAERLIT
jgi:threonine/homoserine/homoserine lactone efflux protein